MPLEAGHDQVDSVVPREVEGRSAADGCTRSLGGVETPRALVEASVSVVPSVSVPVCAVTSVVLVCVVSQCVYTSVAKCVLRRTHTGSGRACVRATPSASPCVDEPTCMSGPPSTRETPYVSGMFTSVPACVIPGTPCVKGAPQLGETTCAWDAARVCEPPRVCETPWVSAPAGVVCMSEARVSERPCVGCVRTACVRSLYTREMSVAMREHAAASPGVSTGMNGNAIVCSLSLVTRGSVSAGRAWRLRLRLWRDKCRVAAVVAFGTGPGLHGSERVVRAVPRARPPRARLRG